MELKITGLQQPGKIAFNYADLKRELTEKVAEYSGIAYSDDQIREAKADRASLNRLKKALNDERIRQEREFMKPFAEFKAQVAELCGIVDNAAAAIDSQIKSFEEAQRQKKAKEIKALWDSKEAPDWMRRTNPKWLNASYPIKNIASDIDGLLKSIESDVCQLDSMGVCYGAILKYQETLDFKAAIAENEKIKAQEAEKAKWEAEHAQTRIPLEVQPNQPEREAPADMAAATQPEAPQEAPRQWIGFQAYLSTKEAAELGRYLRERGIKYKAI